MKKVIVVTFSVPESFVDRVKEMEKLVDKDPLFKRVLEKVDNRYRSRTNKVGKSLFL